MSDVKIHIYTPAQQYVGYFLNPTIEQFPEGEYEISGRFFEENNTAAQKLEFNPQSMPYTAELLETKGLPHSKLINVYVQRGRQPVKMSGSGSN
ncbi:MAG TPA: hypothetical protein V6C81_09150 [Planktothrix sp.]|jgi:hypothetical protein